MKLQNPLVTWGEKNSIITISRLFLCSTWSESNETSCSLYWIILGGHSCVMCLYPEVEEQISVMRMHQLFQCTLVSVGSWHSSMVWALLTFAIEPMYQYLSKAWQRHKRRRSTWLWSVVLAAARSHPQCKQHCPAVPMYLNVAFFNRRKLKIDILKQWFYNCCPSVAGEVPSAGPKDEGVWDNTSEEWSSGEMRWLESTCHLVTYCSKYRKIRCHHVCQH